MKQIQITAKILLSVFYQMLVSHRQAQK